MHPSIVLAILALAYIGGCLKVRSRSSTTRSPVPMHALAMIGALLVIYIAVASPLEELADQALSVHMIQHLLLMLVAAPLLVWARPMPYLIWSLPMPLRKLAGRFWSKCGLSRIVEVLGSPAVTWAIFCSVIALWHVPAIYRWAIGSEVRHTLMHLSFLGSGLLFWSVVIQTRRRRRLNYASCALFVLSAAMITGLAGALIAFAQRPLYVTAPLDFAHERMTALADQQLAGLIMWIPMDLVLFCVTVFLIAAAMHAPHSRDPADLSRW